MPGCRPVCEGCGAKEATFGTPLERKRRWCRGCSKAPGAINLSVKMCEGCGAKEASFGTLLERKRRWCSGCGKLAHSRRLCRLRCLRRLNRALLLVFVAPSVD